MSKNVVIVGGGAAGILAALGASKAGHKVTILEKNEKLGKKIYITGKGRCNVTNASSMEEVRNHVISNPKFMYSSFDQFTNEDLMKLIEEEGIPLKTERGNRVFPVSDKSSDILKALSSALKKNKVKVELHTTVKKLLLESVNDEMICTGVEAADGKAYKADVVILATGGLSYPSTGSTGDGFKFSQAGGHKITALRPALVPLETKEEWVPSLQGLSLRNVEVEFKQGKKKLYSDFGEMLFTHFGVTGPVILSGSSFIGKALEKPEKGEVKLKINLKPALSDEQLDARILRDFEENKNKQFGNSLGGLLPAKMIPVIVDLVGIDKTKKVCEVSKAERRRLVELLHNLTMTITKPREFKEAIITQGGVSVKQINPTTMDSKLVKGLKFAGEMIDVDAHTGGYNLQIAWSTGWAAGRTIEG
ncbi:NAD(FAD)-utilizing dehydrogenase [Lachnospiraceae bacterium TWA4]|nr:NAD(FAD)-utilizing dehydrogenase [Lachnospiraceae bacterium TWA4]